MQSMAHNINLLQMTNKSIVVKKTVTLDFICLSSLLKKIAILLFIATGSFYLYM